MYDICVRACMCVCVYVCMCVCTVDCKGVGGQNTYLHMSVCVFFVRASDTDERLDSLEMTTQFVRYMLVGSFLAMQDGLSLF